MHIHVQIPTCPQDYLDWQVSMFTLFGTKWLRMHGGPKWMCVPTGQSSGTMASLTMETQNVRTNNDYQFNLFMYVAKGMWQMFIDWILYYPDVPHYILYVQIIGIREHPSSERVHYKEIYC